VDWIGGLIANEEVAALSDKFFPKHLKMGVPPVPAVPRPVNTGDFEYTPRSGGRAGCAGGVQSPKSKVHGARSKVEEGAFGGENGGKLVSTGVRDGDRQDACPTNRRERPPPATSNSGTCSHLPARASTAAWGRENRGLNRRERRLGRHGC
jgi:hypothetical protein